MGIDADNELTGIERAHLNALVTEESFKILLRLMEDQVKKFNLNLVNASDPQDIIAKHNLAKAAAQFYQGIVNRVNQEVMIYQQSPKPGDKPFDATASLDMDDIVAAMSELPNFLETE